LPRRTLLLLPALALLLAACSSDPPPLGSGGDPGGQCVPSVQGRPVSIGIYVLENTGHASVTITGVTLPSAQGLTMTRPWLVPIYYDRKNGNHLTVGTGFPYPPPDTPQWRERRLAIGGTIRPGQNLNLVFGVTRTTARSGTSGGPVVTYTAAGSAYTLKEKFTLEAARHC
jgi:hypothetical protein